MSAGARSRFFGSAAGLASAAVLIATSGPTVPAAAAPAAAVCRAGQTDRVEHRAPDALLPRLGKTFAVPAASLRGTSYVRCAAGRLLACMTGANLNCGQGNASRRSPGADAFCHDHPGANVVPMVATGHDSVFDWQCRGTRAVAGQQIERLDDLGFMSRNWRPMR